MRGWNENDRVTICAHCGDLVRVCACQPEEPRRLRISRKALVDQRHGKAPLWWRLLCALGIGEEEFCV